MLDILNWIDGHKFTSFLIVAGIIWIIEEICESLYRLFRKKEKKNAD